MDLDLPAATSLAPTLTLISVPGCWWDLQGDKGSTEAQAEGAETQRLWGTRPAPTSLTPERCAGCSAELQAPVIFLSIPHLLQCH